jgi:hypothetical protein
MLGNRKLSTQLMWGKEEGGEASVHGKLLGKSENRGTQTSNSQLQITHCLNLWREIRIQERISAALEELEQRQNYCLEQQAAAEAQSRKAAEEMLAVEAAREALSVRVREENKGLNVSVRPIKCEVF